MRNDHSITMINFLSCNSYILVDIHVYINDFVMYDVFNSVFVFFPLCYILFLLYCLLYCSILSLKFGSTVYFPL